MRKLLGAAVAASAFFAAMPAQAGHFFGTYTTFGGAPSSASVDFTYDDAVNGAGGHDVLAISGNVDGDAITAFLANPNTPNSAISPDGRWQYDNIFFDGAQVLDLYGVVFTTVSGTEYNLWGNSPTNYTLYSAVNGQFNIFSNGSFQAGAVPETATWAMMLFGFGAMGVAMRRRPAVSFA